MVFIIKQMVCTKCLVACGHSQVPGINVSKNHSPLDDDVTFCILLLMVAKVVNVETAILYGDTEKEIYMEFCKVSWTREKKAMLL